VAPSECWAELSKSESVIGGISELEKLAEIALVMVPGSVEDERRFSALAFLKSKVRNKLSMHLGLVMRMFCQKLFGIESFPYAEALKHWRDRAERGRYLHK
jgi:hypothetical protein